MGLRDLVIPSELVKVTDTEGFSVRGLSLNDAVEIYSRHGESMAVLFDQFVNRVKRQEAVEAHDVGVALVSSAPQIMAEIIAVASGAQPPNPLETDALKRATAEVAWTAEIAAALNFPAGMQMAALQAIGRLTFTSDLPPPKFLGLVLEMAKSATAAINRG